MHGISVIYIRIIVLLRMYGIIAQVSISHSFNLLATSYEHRVLVPQCNIPAV